jgi:hypothetical protein
MDIPTVVGGIFKLYATLKIKVAKRRFWVILIKYTITICEK